MCHVAEHGMSQNYQVAEGEAISDQSNEIRDMYSIAPAGSSWFAPAASVTIGSAATDINRVSEGFTSTI